ncbi:hypothetical protein HPB52_016724 [Rhipicephalus sanguineus]|uniref:SAP domain-containing protein n=1 Tax=Rhipicephalus sanguineus TaxID=34632 RepID=A0A9D4PRQ0_RHISA|nr:hypothetical protein HPB52_016724 [Rhipicephalus sanguineus]
MSFINWRVATAKHFATLNVQLIKTELQRRSLSATGNKEELIDRLLVDTAKDPPPNQEPTPRMHAISTSFPTVPISASLPTFNESGTPTFKHWIEELERIQRLTRWEDPTLLAIAQGKLRGVAAGWHASTGSRLTTWAIWKAGLQEQFGEQLSIIQWQQKRPRTVDDFLSIVSEVDRSLDHARLIRFPQSTEQFAGQPVRPQFQSATPRTDSTVNSPQNARPPTFQHTTPMMQPPRIGSLAPANQEARTTYLFTTPLNL